jgi:lipoprotein-anchoring transpeptidase ErfK/SrfK
LQSVIGMRVLALLGCLTLLTGTIDARVPLPGAPVVNQVLATQVALDRSGFSPGEIDGRAGRNLERAIAAFQRAHQLPPTGQMSDETWKQLAALGGDVPPLVAYAITDADVAGPFTPDIPPNLPDQAALDALNYRTPIEALAERFHSSPALLQQLNPDATFQRPGDRVMVPNVISDPATAASPKTSTAASSLPGADITLVVTKSTSALTIEDAGGHILFHAPVTSGSTHDPLPIGMWSVNGVQRNPKFHYNPELFWDATPGDRKATLQPGPNNPVGIVWIDLSKPHYGIHGTPEPSKIGHVESHGCVRLTNWDANRVAQWVKPGTKVVFRQ